MRYYRDEDLRGHAMIFESPLELLEETEKAVSRPDRKALRGFYCRGLNQDRLTGWNSAKRQLTAPYREGVQLVEEMLEEIRSARLPPPRSRKRQRRRNEDGGDLLVDRLMDGEPDFYTDVSRQVRHGPTNVTLLCNLDGASADSAKAIFWRGAAAAAACDLLEEAGFSVEIWIWCAGTRVYTSPMDEQFTGLILKRAGDPLDILQVIQGLSAWFLDVGIFNSFATSKNKPRSLGRMNYELGAWVKYIEPDPTSTSVLHMPVVWSKEEAIIAAKNSLEHIEQKVT